MLTLTFGELLLKLDVIPLQTIWKGLKERDSTHGVQKYLQPDTKCISCQIIFLSFSPFIIKIKLWNSLYSQILTPKNQMKYYSRVSHNQSDVVVLKNLKFNLL